MGEKLDRLRINAEEQFIASAADILKHRFVNGADIFGEFGSSSSDVFTSIARMVSDAVTPKKNKFLEDLLQENTAEILKSCENLQDNMSGLEGSSIYNTIAGGIQYLLAKELMAKKENLEDKIFVEICSKVASEFPPDTLNQKEFILNLIETTECGWPIVLAKGSLDKDPEVVLAAAKKDEWVLAFASVEGMDSVKSIDERMQFLETKVEQIKMTEQTQNHLGSTPKLNKT